MITVKDINHWKRPLQDVAILKDVVVLPGVVGVLQKETIWLTLGINLELDNRFNLILLLKKYLGY